MSTSDLAIQLRGVINLFAQAGQVLSDGDIAEFRVAYARALRELDAFQDAKAAAIG